MKWNFGYKRKPRDGVSRVRCGDPEALELMARARRLNRLQLHPLTYRQASERMKCVPYGYGSEIDVINFMGVPFSKIRYALREPDVIDVYFTYHSEVVPVKRGRSRIPKCGKKT